MNDISVVFNDGVPLGGLLLVGEDNMVVAYNDNLINVQPVPTVEAVSIEQPPLNPNALSVTYRFKMQWSGTK